jgi:hypothetical protein
MSTGKSRRESLKSTVTGGLAAIIAGGFERMARAQAVAAATPTSATQALPVGNGRLGAMVFGQPASECLQLNEVSIWSGRPQPDADRKDAYKSLPVGRLEDLDEKADGFEAESEKRGKNGR